MILGQLCSDTMRLEYLTKVIQPLTIRGPQHLEVEGIAYDSRRVQPGYLFVALHGRTREGTDFIRDAIQRGAVAVLSELNDWTRRDVTLIRVEDARRALAEIACEFHGEPSRRLQMAGITGTNGKSTVAFMLRDILRADGRTPGLIGTVRYEIGERSIPATRTTPEAPDIQAMLERMLKAGCRSAVMEVSSHGLDQKRAWGIDFDVGVFTNLSQDHLDYHGTMEEYFAAKTLLFRGLGQIEKHAHAVINIDDPWGMRLANTNGFTADLVTYGVHPGATVRAEEVEITADGSAFAFRSPWGDGAVRLKLLGRFNVSNALGALAAGGALGVAPRRMAEALEAMVQVPGRLDRIPHAGGFSVFVDYAHTPDALTHVLTTLREIAPRRLIAVFGCGGNRDRGKRPLMARAATSRADHTILTTDNPRHEDPLAILREIAEGVAPGSSCEIIADREQAIARAIAGAGPGDIVLIAGKGHENYQEIGDTVVPFDDREVAARLLRRR